MSNFNLENLDELAEDNQILKACLDVADRELASYGEALEAAVVFLVLENKDLRAEVARVGQANNNVWTLATEGLLNLSDPGILLGEEGSRAEIKSSEV